MRINSIQQPTPQSSVKRQNLPAFTALYFKTPKLQRDVQNTPEFVKILSLPEIKQVIDKYNVVIINCKKIRGNFLSRIGNYFSSDICRKIPLCFSFRACTDVIQKGDKILPSGMKTPVLKAGDSLKQDINTMMIDNRINYYYKEKPLGDLLTNLLDKETMFNKIYFKNDKVKEAFQQNYEAYEFLSTNTIPAAIKRGYNLLVTETSGGNSNIKFRVSTALAQRGDNLIAAGYMSPEVVFRKLKKPEGGFFEPLYLYNSPEIFQKSVKHLDNYLNSIANNKSIVEVD